MKKSFFICIAIIACAFPLSIAAQWKIVASNVLTSYNNGGGVITYKDGLLSIGKTSYDYHFSLDSGKTWTAVGLYAASYNQVFDVSFYDKHTGVVSTSNGIYMTHDGGQTWKQSYHSNQIPAFWKISFNHSPLIIHAFGNGNMEEFLTTLDGGLTWQQDTVFKGPGNGLSLTVGKDGTVYALVGLSYPSLSGIVCSSSDYGATWQKLPSANFTREDSYSIDIDSCNSERLYIANENYYERQGQSSGIYYSSDHGVSWNLSLSHSLPYISGALAVGPHTVYAGTVNDGILRSTDQGMSWKNIGGPSGFADCRSICVVNDNFLFALDTSGNVWETTNSGGDSLTFSGNENMRFSSGRIIKDSFNITVHLPIYFHKTAAAIDMDMIMHYYPGSLKLLSTTLYNGKSFDLSAGQWPGRSALHFDAADLNAAPDSLLGSVNFIWTPFESSCEYITFDSLTKISEAPCSSGSGPLPFEGIIGSYKECGLTSVAETVAAGRQPLFSFSPNPAKDFGTIASATYSGLITAKLYDGIGRAVATFEGSVVSGGGMKIPLHDLPSGLYHVSILGKGVQSELSFVH